MISTRANASKIRKGFSYVPIVTTTQWRTREKNKGFSYRKYSAESKVSLPTEADVVVVGGGVIGCFTLYHLARLGCSPVLLERHKLTSGTTWHTNGLIWRLRPGEIDTALLNNTRDIVLELEKEEPAGLTTNGGLFIASNKLRLEEYARLFTIGRTAGVECYLLTPKEVKELYPLLNVDDVTGALYSPGDGSIDPSTLCATLTRQAKLMGAKVYEGVDVTKLETKESLLGGKMIQGVQTTSGFMKTQAVVNCTGVWCEDIMQPSGLGNGLPQVGMEHSIVVMEPLPGLRNMPNVRDHDANMCFKVQGESLVIGGYELNAPTCKVDRSFSFGLYDFNMDNFLEIMEGAIHRVPKLAEMGIKTTLCGPESFTPDRKPVLGEDWDVRGLYHGFGFNSSGIMLSGGCSEQLAHLILHGRPLLDMAAYDCRRFPKRARNWKKWAEERSHESYTSNYSIVFPHNQPLAGRSAITDALYQRLTDSGCFWEECLCWERPGFFTSSPLPLKSYDWKGAFGRSTHENYCYRDILQQGHTFELPLYYEQIKREYMAMKTTSALVNSSSSGKMAISGPDVEKAVDWLFMNEVNRKGGRVSTSLVLNGRAGIEANVTIFTLNQDTRLSCEDNDLYMIQSDSGTGPYVRRLLQTMCQDKGLDVSFRNLTYDISSLLLIGPLSQELLQATLGQEDIPTGTHIICNVKGIKTRLRRCSNDMWELQVPSKDLVPLYDILMAKGNMFGLKNAGYRALNIYQLEHGIPSWHSDIRADDTPVEAGLCMPENLDSQNRNFMGKDVIIDQRTHGVKKSRIYLEAPNCQPLWGNEGILRDGQLVGIIRKADYSFQRDAPLAVGYVNHIITSSDAVQQSMQASVWEIENQGKRYPAQLYQPKTMKVPGV